MIDYKKIRAILAAISKDSIFGPEDEEALKQNTIKLFRLEKDGTISYYFFIKKGTNYVTSSGVIKGDKETPHKESSTIKASLLKSMYTIKKKQGFKLTAASDLTKTDDIDVGKIDTKIANDTKSVVKNPIADIKKDKDIDIPKPDAAKTEDEKEAESEEGDEKSYGISTMSNKESELLQALADLIHRLQGFSAQAFATRDAKSRYAVKMTVETIYKAQHLLNDLETFASEATEENLDEYIEEFNNRLVSLLLCFPQQKNIKSQLLKYTAKAKKNVETFNKKVSKIILTEQEYLDTLLNEVLSTGISNAENVQAVIDSVGLRIQRADNAFIKDCCDHLGQVNGMNYAPRFYKIINPTTQAAFDSNASECIGSNIIELWHGSASGNWLSLISGNGIQIKPAGVKHTGSMYGPGLYFADKAIKSYGYTSADDAIWTSSGVAKKADAIYLGLYKVRVGKVWSPKGYNHSYSKLTLKDVRERGADSVFARAGDGNGLKNNEYIIYDTAQCTIYALIEMLKPVHPDFDEVKANWGNWRKDNPWKKDSGWL